jgi:hypothetical protein
MRLGSPIQLYHQGRNGEDAVTLYAPEEVSRRAWNDAIQKQREIKFKRKPAFGIADRAKRYEFFADIQAHDMVLFGNKCFYIDVYSSLYRRSLFIGYGYWCVYGEPRCAA